ARRTRPVTAVLLALLALQTPVDEGTLVVREDTVEVAREAFRVTAVRTGAGVTRWTLATTIRYDRTRPVVVLDPIVELGPDSNPVSLEYTVADPREPMRILGQLNRDPAALQHITVTGGENRLVHLWLDADGRVAKIEVPSRRLVAERAPAS